MGEYTPAEQALIFEVIRVARLLQHAGGFEVRLRPGFSPYVVKVRREVLADFAPLNDSESYAARKAAKQAG